MALTPAQEQRCRDAVGWTAADEMHPRHKHDGDVMTLQEQPDGSVLVSEGRSQWVVWLHDRSTTVERVPPPPPPEKPPHDHADDELRLMVAAGPGQAEWATVIAMLKAKTKETTDAGLTRRLQRACAIYLGLAREERDGSLTLLGTLDDILGGLL